MIPKDQNVYITAIRTFHGRQTITKRLLQ